MAALVGADLIASDNLEANNNVLEAPPLANIRYPTVDGSIGVGMLLKATIGSNSPLFSRMRNRFLVLVALLGFVIIFCSAFLGTVSPNIEICCADRRTVELVDNVSGMMTTTTAVVATATPAGTSPSLSSSSAPSAPIATVPVDAPRDVLLAYAALFCPMRRTFFERLADAMTSPPLLAGGSTSTTTTTTTTTLSGGATVTMKAGGASLDGNTPANLACAQRLCSLSAATLRSDALKVARFGDAAGGPADTASAFLFAAVGPAVTIFVLSLLLLVFEVILAYFIARKLATKTSGKFAFAFYIFNVLLFLCLLAEAAALTAHMQQYHSDTTVGPRSRKVDCDELADPVSRQLCHTGADCGVELRTRIGNVATAAPLGLAGTLLVLTAVTFVAALGLFPFPSAEDEALILPSRPNTLIFNPGRAAPEGIPEPTVVRLQHKIDNRMQARMSHDVKQAELEKEKKMQQRVYGERPDSGAAKAAHNHSRKKDGAHSPAATALSAPAAKPASADGARLPTRPKQTVPAFNAGAVLAEAEKERARQEHERIAARRAKFSTPAAPKIKSAPVNVFSTPTKADDDDGDDVQERTSTTKNAGAMPPSHAGAKKNPAGGAAAAVPADVMEEINAIAKRIKSGGHQKVVAEAYASELHPVPTSPSAAPSLPPQLYQSQQVSAAIDSISARLQKK